MQILPLARQIRTTATNTHLTLLLLVSASENDLNSIPVRHTTLIIPWYEKNACIVFNCLSKRAENSGKIYHDYLKKLPGLFQVEKRYFSRSSVGSQGAAPKFTESRKRNNISALIHRVKPFSVHWMRRRFSAESAILEIVVTCLENVSDSVKQCSGVGVELLRVYFRLRKMSMSIVHSKTLWNKQRLNSLGESRHS